MVIAVSRVNLNHYQSEARLDFRLPVFTRTYNYSNINGVVFAFVSIRRVHVYILISGAQFAIFYSRANYARYLGTSYKM